MSGVLDRVAGRSGELVLRRRAGQLEVIVNGVFVISTENEASSGAGGGGRPRRHRRRGRRR